MKHKRFFLFLFVLFLALLVLVGLWVGKKESSLPLIPAPFPTSSPKIIGPDGEVMVENTANYNFLYSPQEQKYTIIVYGSPFAKSRYKAETAFLKHFGFTQEQACSLTVTLVTPNFINPAESQRIYHLSFCETAFPTPTP